MSPLLRNAKFWFTGLPLTQDTRRQKEGSESTAIKNCLIVGPWAFEFAVIRLAGVSVSEQPKILAT